MGIFKNSRYEHNNIITVVDNIRGAIPVLSRVNRFLLPKNGEVIRHQVIESDTVDYLAYKFLGDSTLWWVIMDCNTQFMTPWDIKVGDILIIPTSATVRRANYGI